MKLHFLHKKLTHNIEFSTHINREFLKLWHHHPELELVYIVQGEGTLYTGDFIGDFKKDDIFLLGSNLPHMFSSKSYLNTQSLSKAFVFHINNLFFSDGLISIPEFSFLRDILSLSQRGMMFRQEENRKLLNSFKNFKTGSSAENAIKVLQLFLHLSSYKEYTPLGSFRWLDQFQIKDKRINQVIEYIMLNFRENINLGKAAEISGMNKSAFCRYFKKSTGKSFIAFVNETRINYSCKLLNEKSKNLSISEICYHSGFNSVSYYNRTFKRFMGCSPSEYST